MLLDWWRKSNHLQRVGPYEIQAEIGRGGMGVVLPHDPRLERDVAIKVFDHLADNADRLGRFQREAKVLASLNHTSIAAIYGSEEFEGKQYLVLEYVKGSSLDQHLEGGPLPIDEARYSSRTRLPRHSKPPTRMVLFTAISSPPM